LKLKIGSSIAKMYHMLVTPTAVDMAIVDLCSTSILNTIQFHAKHFVVHGFLYHQQNINVPTAGAKAFVMD
jgi:hypothetical protein